MKGDSERVTEITEYIFSGKKIEKKATIMDLK